MFSDNEKISEKQLERQFFLISAGPLFLWMAPGLSGKEGILAVASGSLLLGVWILLLQRQKGAWKVPRRYWGTWLEGGIVLLLQSYLLVTGTWLLGKAASLVSVYLVPGLPFGAGVLLLAGTALGGGQDLQSRGRLAGILWPVIGGGLWIFLLLAAGMENWRILPISTEPWKTSDLLWTGNRIWWFLCGYSGLIFLLFPEVRAGQEDARIPLAFRIAGKLLLWTIAVVLVLHAGFGPRGGNGLEYPLLDLMAGVRFPGGFLLRVDLMVLVLLLVSLLFALSSIFFYSGYVNRRKGWYGGRWPMTMLCVILAAGRGSDGILAGNHYPNLLCCIFFPAFLALTFCTMILRRRAHES